LRQYLRFHSQVFSAMPQIALLVTHRCGRCFACLIY
jgi:hypothetical protein